MRQSLTCGMTTRLRLRKRLMPPGPSTSLPEASWLSTAKKTSYTRKCSTVTGVVTLSTVRQIIREQSHPGRVDCLI